MSTKRETRPIAIADIAAVLGSAASENDPQATLRFIDALAQCRFGHKLFTVMRHLAATSEVERLYSSNPTAYPVGGRKHKRGTDWGRSVLGEGKVNIARNAEELRASFPDHELIFSLGITSIMNIPAMFMGRCVGTMNLSGEEGQYGEGDVPAALILAGLIVPFTL